jgi:hypothetical protein
MYVSIRPAISPDGQPQQKGIVMSYVYEWVGIGLLITDFETGRDVFLQGEEGSDLHDDLEDCETEELVQAILSEYSVLFED